nr:hypothetical protein [Hafnia alvei]
MVIIIRQLFSTELQKAKPAAKPNMLLDDSLSLMIRYLIKWQLLKLVHLRGYQRRKE